MTQWDTIYQQCCSVLLEPGGFSLGLITDDDFFAIADEVLNEFIDKTRLVERIWNDQMLFGISRYPYPENHLGVGVDGVIANDLYLFNTSGFYIDNYNSTWPDFAWAGQPDRFREDEIPFPNVELYPTPNVTGNRVVGSFPQNNFFVDLVMVNGVQMGAPPYSFSVNGTMMAAYPAYAYVNNVLLPPASVGVTSSYGVPAYTMNPNDFDLVPDVMTPIGYGTIAGQSGGNPFVDNAVPGYGIISTMTPSTGNVTIFSRALPYQMQPDSSNNLFQIQRPTRQSVVQLVPDSLTPYLKYGILARIFNSDSELRDVQKAAYCNARYAEGVNMCAVMMSQEMWGADQAAQQQQG